MGGGDKKQRVPNVFIFCMFFLIVGNLELSSVAFASTQSDMVYICPCYSAVVACDVVLCGLPARTTQTYLIYTR